jgi:uncharacterized OsmC-like protein
MSAAESRFALQLTLEDDYRFTVDFGADPPLPEFTVDELPPLGSGQGPNPARLLATAVGHCLGASLLYCLRRSRIDVHALRTTVEGTMVRNERGRLRIGEIRVTLAPDVDPDQRERMGRCLGLFEDFCIVTESVRKGIPVTVQVEAGAAAPYSALSANGG